VKPCRVLRAVLVYLGFAERRRAPERLLFEPGSELGWVGWGFILMAAVTGFAVSNSLGAHSSSVQLRVSYPSQAEAIAAVLGDPFREKHAASFLDGSVDTYYSPSADNLLVSIENVAAPPAGYSVRTVITCSGHDKTLGNLAPRFFGNRSGVTARNSFVKTRSGSCTSLRMQQISPSGTLLASVVLSIAPARFNDGMQPMMIGTAA
jgi:hypothetical protein